MRKKISRASLPACLLLLILSELAFHTHSGDRAVRSLRRRLGMPRRPAPSEPWYGGDEPAAPGGGILEEEAQEEDRVRDAPASAAAQPGLETGGRTRPVPGSGMVSRAESVPTKGFSGPARDRSKPRTAEGRGEYPGLAQSEASREGPNRSKAAPPERSPRTRAYSGRGISPRSGDFHFSEAAGKGRKRENWRVWLDNPDWDGSRRGRSGSAPVSVKSGEPSEDRREALKKRAGGKLGRSPRARETKGRLSRAGLRLLLGAGALKPPQGRLNPPDFRRLAAGLPPVLPDGTPLPLSAPEAGEVERLKPPGTSPNYRDWISRESRGLEPHWHSSGQVRYLHEGPLWAAPLDGRWAAMEESGRRWWALAAGDQPLVWHEDHWWWKLGDTWFLLHQGQPWAYRWFGDWERAGLANLETGTRIVYSSDGLKAAVATPGEGVAVFDLRTGEEIGRQYE